MQFSILSWAEWETTCSGLAKTNNIERGTMLARAFVLAAGDMVGCVAHLTSIQLSHSCKAGGREKGCVDRGGDVF